MVGRSSLKKRSMLRQRPACSRHRSYMRWISAIYVATDQPTPPWPSHKPPSPETPATTPSKNSCRLWHLSRPTLCPSEAARPPIRRLGERRKSIDVWINSGTRVEKTLALLLPPALTMGLRKICSRLRASTVTRKGTTQGISLSPERTCQKTSIGLGDLRSDN